MSVISVVRAAALLLLLSSLMAAAESNTPVLDPQNWSRQTWDTESGLPQNTVQAILQSRDGYIWLATEGGLARFDGIKFTVYNSKNTPALRSNNARALVEDRQGALWVATADGVTRLLNGKFEAFTASEGLPNNDVSALYQDQTGAVCAITLAGSACFHERHFRSSASTPSLAPSVPESAIPPLFNDRVLCTYKDREGNLWVGTESSGVTILRDLKFRSYTKREDGLDDVVRCVFQDHQDNIWIGTNQHGLVRYRDGKFSRLTTADGLSSNVVLSLGEDAEGNLLVGTPDGLNRLNHGSVSVLTSADGLIDDFVRSILTDQDGSVWIATRRGLSNLSQGRFRNYTHADGLGSDLVGSMLREKNGSLWIATLQGLSRLQNGAFKNYTIRDGLSSNVITALYCDQNRVLWIGTQGGGLNRFQNGRFERVAANLDLPEVIYGITEDQDANLWFSSDTGIFRVNRRDLARYFDGASTAPAVVSYGTSDGLRVSECSSGGHPAIWKASDDNIWFATLKGAALLRAHANRINNLPPPVVIESVSVDERLLAASDLSHISPGRERLGFEYAGLSFVAPPKVRYRYKLEGFDRKWIDAGTARTAYYTNLPHGSYHFRVLARNNDGIWNEQGASIDLTLEPHFYQTYWFYAALLAALVSLGYAAYRLRVKQVEAQFNAVLQERTRIAREIHDTLAQGFAGVSVQLELVARLLSSSVETAREHLDQARMLVRNSLAEARRSIWELRSQSSETEDLASRLGKMVSMVAGSAPGKVALEIRGVYRPIAPNMEDELLKIAREAVTNAVRHAQAQHIKIELAFDANRLRMTIADDGRGFVPGATFTDGAGHFGLKGMHERADQIQAQLNVESVVGQGTTISVEAPVH